jgi:hypothetical protein
MSAAFDRDALLDAFDSIGRAGAAGSQYETIADEPVLTPDERLHALVGAIAQYLATQRRLRRVPAWVCNPARRLAEPWLTTASPSDAMREYLTFASSAEFASRNIFTEERPLRRGRGPQTVKARVT